MAGAPSTWRTSRPKKHESLHTRDKTEACRLLAARNETAPAFSLQLARVYWKDCDAGTRHWQFVMEEDRAIVAREGNDERRAFYQMAWHLGLPRPISRCWRRAISIGPTASSATPGKSLGNTRPCASTRRSPPCSALPPTCGGGTADRATEFNQRCRGLKISRITLHSYRYAWAERTKSTGYPERFAQQALGHNSNAVYRAYVIIPSLGEYKKKAEERRVIPFQTPAIPAVDSGIRYLRFVSIGTSSTMPFQF